MANSGDWRGVTLTEQALCRVSPWTRVPMFGLTCGADSSLSEALNQMSGTQIPLLPSQFLMRSWKLPQERRVLHHQGLTRGST